MTRWISSLSQGVGVEGPPTADYVTSGVAVAQVFFRPRARRSPSAAGHSVRASPDLSECGRASPTESEHPATASPTSRACSRVASFF